METLQHAETLLSLSPDATFIVDADGKILFASQQTISLLGYQPEELLGQPVEVLIPSTLSGGHPDVRRDYVAKPSLRPMGRGRDLLALTKDGQEIPVEVSLSPIATDDGLLVSAALRDVSYRVEYEHALKAARDSAEQANKVKSRFLAAASHDLRQPLQSLSAYLAVLKHQLEGADFRDVADKMELSLTAMGSLLDALLDISQLESGSIAPRWSSFGLQHLLDKVLASNRPAADRKGLTLSSLPTNLIVRSDEALLARIIDNFVSNAIRYTDAGSISIDCTAAGDIVKVIVTDTGLGIAPDQIPHIFEEYYQLDNPARDRGKGLGLGLAIVKRVSDLLGHEIDVTSTQNAGSQFTVSVPLAKMAELAPDPRAPTNREGGEDQIKLLLVDDDAAVLDSMKLLLGLSGFDIDVAKAPDEALAILEGGHRPDILISDYRLPVMNGVELIKQVRLKADPNIPVVLMTGDTSADEIRSQGLANCHIVHKPTNTNALIELIRSISAPR
jgi:PAS domain S-box-containing protein